MLFKNNYAMREVFNALFNEGYQLQKRTDNSFWVILPSNSKYEIFDNGNDCICIGGYRNSYDYQTRIEDTIENVLSHVSILK